MSDETNIQILNYSDITTFRKMLDSYLPNEVKDGNEI